MTARPGLVFVYGTLQPGEERWPILAPFVHGEGRPATVPGQLYDTGNGYPAALFTGRADRVVVGRVFTLREDTMTVALEVLDEVEAAVEGLYRRIVVTTADGESAWTYEFGDGLQLEPISSGDWLRRG